ncbi:ShlB/FhaC/HecB family hemolysin secretion/activation protein [Polaromonas sp.]|uniref:ShlB/FhaC/HecB family hemolysin secretion/activation protein n=1 Tax=Polaromonas sp. TaxID=1869339 RepID=UPI0024879E39|nr:ShlB/FhaC/HecB family hemolysin secretion/activation protein [Polaromonas sp.]MDI1271998.1 ShlB/FhaC/HecB family hemolysin secretion/activation protein [Polaromonas sp.]
MQEPQRQLPLLPKPGAPPIGLPAGKTALPVQAAVSITPAAFRFEGNTLFDQEALAALLVDRVNRTTDLAGLTEAAALVSRYYRAQGYLLTEAYLPEQAFQAVGGTVTIAVIEARIGRVHVQFEGDNGSASYARRVVGANLQPGALISEYLLDKPVLLLRDLAGVDASATVEPGQRPGQADVIVTIRAQGPQVDGSVGVDNFGARAAGPLHLSASLNVSNLAGRGDVFSARAQTSNATRSNLYRLAYAVSIDTAGTRLAVSAARTDYALGEQFAALGATGKADILGVALTRPLIRSRDNNLYGLLSLEHKKFNDQITTPANDSERRITATRVGLLGNFSDDMIGAGGSSSYALTGTLGRTRLDAISLGFDQGPGGLRTAGGFGKLNLEFQRTQLFGSASSMLFGFQTQLASRNLASAEKMALGGPNGVRGYPVGEGIGDAGLLFNLEYRYQLPAPVTLAGEPVSLAAFYDYGTVRFNQDDSAVLGVTNRIALGSVGIGALAGRVNNFMITTYLAWRTTRSTPSTGDPDRSPRAWVSAQKWF